MSSRERKSPSSKLALVVVCLIVLLLMGCGYHFAGTGSQAPGDIKSIAVDVLQNNTAEIGLESVFTNAIPLNDHRMTIE